MQLVVLTMESPFKVYCAVICRIINITVFIHIILGANICNISISIPNKVAIEKVTTSFGHKTIGVPWFGMAFSGSHGSFSSLLSQNIISSSLKSTLRNSSFHEKTLKNHAHFLVCSWPKKHGWMGLLAIFVHIILYAKLCQENILRMVSWHCPPDTGLEIRALVVWGRARPLGNRGSPQN